MDKLQAYNTFWNGFIEPMIGADDKWKAYEEASVPSNAVLPYITYESASDDFGSSLALTASLWDRSSAWTTVIAKLKQVETEISRGGKMVAYDGGAFWIRKAQPWAQRMTDETDSSVKRIVLNLVVEFID